MADYCSLPCSFRVYPWPAFDPISAPPRYDYDGDSIWLKNYESRILMNIERIRSFYDQRPVRPFTIHTASGETYTVKHPETIAIDEEDEIIILLPERGKLAMMDMASITEITQNFVKQETNT